MRSFNSDFVPQSITPAWTSFYDEQTIKDDIPEYKEPGWYVSKTDVPSSLAAPSEINVALVQMMPTKAGEEPVLRVSVWYYDVRPTFVWLSRFVPVQFDETNNPDFKVGEGLDWSPK